MTIQTETEALRQVYDLAKQHGWKLALFTRQDIHTTYKDTYGDDPSSERVDRVMRSTMWCKVLEEVLTNEGTECIWQAIQDTQTPEEAGK